MTAIAYGIDFGTSNSSIAIAHENGRVEVLPIDAGSLLPDSLPSISYIDRLNLQETGQAAVSQYVVTGMNQTRCRNCSLVEWDREGGHTRCRQFRPSQGCHDARLISGVKGELADTRFAVTHSWARDFSLEDLVAISMRELKRRADRYTGRDVRRVVVGHPVVFEGADGEDYEDRQDRAKERLEHAAGLAGFDHIALFPEPVAVLFGQAFSDGYSLAVDFGGGTFDAAVMEVREGEAEVLSQQGAAVGGERFDATIFDRKVGSAIGLNQVVRDVENRDVFFPAWIRNRLRTLTGVRHLLADPRLTPALERIKAAGGATGNVDAILHGGFAFDFYKAIESAKIELSRSASARIQLSRPGLRLAESITRAEFEGWISADLDVTVDAMDGALEEADLGPEDISVVLRTGGSSLIPAFVDRLESRFPKAEIRERPAFTSVAHGLGMYAHQTWG